MCNVCWEASSGFENCKMLCFIPVKMPIVTEILKTAYATSFYRNKKLSNLNFS